MTSQYMADMFKTVTFREVVRMRPGMYVGCIDDGTGPLRLLLEVVANAIDQVLLARCTRVDVRIDADDFITVTDDGPGIPAPLLVNFLEQPSNRATADGHSPHVHLGIGGLGLPIANALSDPLEVDTVHAGEQATVAYAGGLQQVPLRVGAASRPSGTRVRFRPDPRLFRCARVPRVELTQRLEDLAFLLPTVALSWSFAVDGAAGLVGRLRAEVGDRLGDVVHHQGDYATDDGPTTVEVALAWRSRSFRRAPQIHSFANLQRTEGGEHVTGLLAGVREFLKIRGDHGLEGLVAAVAVLLADVRYGSPINSTLVNPGVRPAVKEATWTALQGWVERSPEAAEALRNRVRAR